MNQFNDSRKISILIRDINGKREWRHFDNVDDFNSSARSEWTEADDESEIIIVIWGDVCIYSSLASATPITLDDLTGFFA